MRVRRSWLVLGMLLIPTAVRADDHRADLYAGFSGGGGGSKLFGFHESFAWSSPWPTTKDLSFVLSDVSVHFGSHDGKDVTQVAFMWGARWTWAKPERSNKFSGQFLAGSVYSNDGVDSGKDGAFAVGFGWEFIPTPNAPSKGLGFKVQADYINRGGDRDNFARISGGVIYRFGQHK